MSQWRVQEAYRVSRGLSSISQSQGRLRKSLRDEGVCKEASKVSGVFQEVLRTLQEIFRSFLNRSETLLKPLQTPLKGL